MIVRLATNQSRWQYLGAGLAIGMVLHICLDILLSFEGVSFLWPVQWTLNLWQWFTPPGWLEKILLTSEFLLMAIFFISLQVTARRQNTDPEYMRTLRTWIAGFFGWFVFFTVLAFIMQQGFLTFYNLFYLLSLGLAVGVVIRMHKTVEPAGNG
jgi:hypothetical protein